MTDAFIPRPAQKAILEYTGGPMGVSAVPGSGKITITGNLKDVMKESAGIALTTVRGFGDELDAPPSYFEKNALHLHIPEGAIPKDGPSAGITMDERIHNLMVDRGHEHLLLTVDDPDLELVLQDMNFSRRTTGEEGLDLIRLILELDRTLPVVVMTAWASIELAVEAIRRAGAGARAIFGTLGPFPPLDGTLLGRTPASGAPRPGSRCTLPAPRRP